MRKPSFNTDAKGWTWIFRNNKNPKSKIIDNPYNKDLERFATSFYVSNFSDSLDAKGLWKTCLPYGRLVDAFIANKRSKGGFMDLSIHHVGGLWIWIQFSSPLSCSKFWESDSLKSIYSAIKAPSPLFRVDERMIWLEINGLPLCAWGSNSYKKIASLFGKFKFFEDEETSMSLGRVCISTKSIKQISVTIKVEVNGELFDVNVLEIGIWNTNITDTASDVSSHMEANHLDKDDTSVEDKENDDLDDIDGIMKDLDNDAKNEENVFVSPKEVVLDQPIKQVEEDILKQPEEECIKVSESSDLSRPPGFKNIKKTLSNNSKCSTNFARHHKKDIKVHWNNEVGDCFMINIYGPQESAAKSSLWNRLAEFMNQHNGKFILFGDFNTVLHEYERSGSLFSRIEAEHFNAFIDSTGLIDLPIGGRHFKWMNKARTKLSKLDRFLISKGVMEDIPDIKVTAIERLWSDHFPILLY
nr:RNA-directed DNA polymerase, eukaryota [Tanacetum cinerariifolium]